MTLPPAELVEILPDGTKVKRRAPRMRACDEKNDKGKLCTGHLKRFFGGPPGEIYRCERCHTLYLPNPAETPRSQTLSY